MKEPTMNNPSTLINDPDIRPAASQESPATYDYSPEIQVRIAAMVLFDNRSILHAHEFAKPEYFDNPVLRVFVTIMLQYISKYRRLMPLDVFLDEVKSFLDENHRPDVSEFWDVFDFILALGKDMDFDYVYDQVSEFAKYQATKNAILDSAHLLREKRDYPEIKRRINEAIDSTPGEDNEELHCVRVSDVEEEEVHWLMPNRLPYNELTIWGGDPGAGKSYLSLWLAAHISAGIPWETDPAVAVERGSVIILNTEDSIANTIRKRLRLNGADLGKCLVIDSVLRKDKVGGEHLFSLTKDLDRLKKKIEEVGDVRLLIIDLLDTYLGRNVDSNKGTDISAVLAPLRRFAEQNHIAVLGLMHLNKNQQSSFIYRLLGSVKLIGIPRVVEFITKDRTDPRTRYFQIAKNNTTDEDWETLSFAFHKESDGRIVIEQDADIPLIEDQVGPETKEEVREKHKKKEEAIAILCDIFKSDSSDGEVRASEVMSHHPEIYQGAWLKARKELGVRAVQEDGVWWWILKRNRRAGAGTDRRADGRR